MIKDDFTHRHNGPQPEDVDLMLKIIGVSSLDELIDKTIPASIRFKEDLPLPEGMTEGVYLTHLKNLFAKNKIYKSYIGMGYYDTYTPAVVLRNIIENPGWYTAYTPYQAEIAQGRLEALLNYQTMISDLTGMALANASMLDESTAAAEMMLMFFYSRKRDAIKKGVNKFFVPDDVFPQTLAVIQTNALPQNIEIVTGDPSKITIDESFFGVMLQYPNSWGEILDHRKFAADAKAKGVFVGVAADLLALTLLTPPGEWGADCVVGNTQRFGVSMGFGGPHAGYFACNDDLKRQMPGRIIGVTIDAQGNKALRMALQTREQHIKREKATSNICTASALSAITAGFFGMWHGPKGLKDKAIKINVLSGVLAAAAVELGYKNHNPYFFDTICLQVPEGMNTLSIKEIALKHEMNFYYWCDECISISLGDTVVLEDVNEIIKVLALAVNKPYKPYVCTDNIIPPLHIQKDLQRTSDFMTHEVFSKYHSETEMMRYMKMLEIKDLSLNRAMIPLGSCTMKLNAAAEVFPLSWPEVGAIHPFAPNDQVEGYLEMIREMDHWLSIITGFKAVSFQPNSGAYGEYAGITAIRNYHISKGETQRDICLIPASAHGTNPASAAKAGLEIIIVKSTEQGEIDVEDLRAKALENKDRLSCIMVTYPSTHGVFEEAILEIINIIHENGGLVYMDGANMNAQVGLTSPGFMGADVCHLNLHKTFAIPHGGGGPGVGPIGVAEHLVDFLPNHVLIPTGGKNGTQVAGAPYGSAAALPITYGYLKMLGQNGLKEATRYAILNANYIKARLQDHFKIMYTGSQGMCAHELILDCNEFERTAGVQVNDIAKRLMDYGFHAPTVAFPVHGTLMIEPTESEPLGEMDRLCEAFISIREEIREIETGKADKINNVIKNAPHTMGVICSDEWDKPYSRQKAAFPMPHTEKYWPTVGKVNDAHGDRNLQCSCEDF